MRRFFPAAAALALAGCGYIAGPLPPLANVPAQIADLAATQRGANLVIQFTAPQNTTEGRPLKQPTTIELRTGPGPEPFDADRWAAATKAVPTGPTKPGIARYEVPATEWIGKEVVVGARATGANGKEDGWVYKIVPVVAPPETPRDVAGKVVYLEPGAAAVRLTWKAAGPRFRVLRAAGDANRFDIAATLDTPPWTDTQVQAGARYRYLVQTVVPLGENREAESDLSAPLAVTVEQPPPSTPRGLRAVPAPSSIELAWDTNPEPSVTAYRVYRAVSGGAPQKIGETSQAPTYSDRTAEHGKSYRYSIAAVDSAGRESAPSDSVEVSLP